MNGRSLLTIPSPPTENDDDENDDVDRVVTALAGGPLSNSSARGLLNDFSKVCGTAEILISVRRRGQRRWEGDGERGSTES